MKVPAYNRGLQKNGISNLTDVILGLVPRMTEVGVVAHTTCGKDFRA